MIKTGILLINLGTPDSPAVGDVRKFLREFLMDPLVVDLPFLQRWLLVNLIIVPFRGPKSASEYQLLWTAQGSPLKVHSQALLEKLKVKYEGKYSVALAMRYQNPDIGSTLQSLRISGCERLLVLPLFPQYAEATTLSILNKVSAELVNMNWSVEINSIKSFPMNDGYIDALINRSEIFDKEKIDHTVFSYHGLPERQLKKINKGCLNENCCDAITTNNQNCYRAQCFATSRSIAKKMQLSVNQYSVCFQSRQGNIPWIQPYIDDLIVELAKQGKKKIRVFSPAFVADCLETTIEIGHTYRQLFIEHGGDELYLVPGLNSSDTWVDALDEIINKSMTEG